MKDNVFIVSGIDRKPKIILMKIALVILMVLHGAVHSMGFVKAFRIADVSQLANPIQRTNGVLWLLAGLLFIFAGILFSTEKEWWWVFSVTAVLISQYLIVNDWSDARFGSVVNIIIFLASIVGFIVWCLAKN
jgi:vacuolar-type H+-ATPase subunit I/STV1